MNGNEQAVITAFLDGKHQHMIGHIHVAYFVSQDAQDIFRAIKELHRAMKPIDFFQVTQSQRFKASNVTISQVAQLIDNNFSVVTFEKHVAELKTGLFTAAVQDENGRSEQTCRCRC